MIEIRNGRHAALVLRHLRKARGLTIRQLAGLLFVAHGTVGNREQLHCDMPAGAMLDTAHALGYAVALIPQRHPGARPTGTGWPA